MKSILENRPALKAEIDKVAEVAGYLWQRGWAERNGGNITINITEHVDAEIRAMASISEKYPIGTTLSALKGCYFFCKGTNRRMRDLARFPMEMVRLSGSATIAHTTKSWPTPLSSPLRSSPRI